MHLFMTCGVNDSGKSTLLKQVAVIAPAVIGEPVVVVPSSRLKREIMAEEPKGPLYAYRDSDWSVLDQKITEILNFKFFERLCQHYGNTQSIIAVENHLTYRHLDHFVRVVPLGSFNRVSGIILMLTEPKLAMSRRGQHVKDTEAEDLVRECQDIESAEASMIEAGIGKPTLRLTQRSCEWNFGDFRNLPSINELAYTAACFIKSRVNQERDTIGANLR